MTAWSVSRGSAAEYRDLTLTRGDHGATLTARVGPDGRPEWLTMRLHLQRPPRWGLRVAEWVARVVIWILAR